MCVGIPAKVVRVGADIAYVKVGDGKVRRASLAVGEGVRRGDYVLLYADLIVSKIGRREATETVKLMRELAKAAEEDGNEGDGGAKTDDWKPPARGMARTQG